MGTKPAGRPHHGSRYEIRIRGHLSTRWATRFDGMTLTARGDGTTVIEGLVVDQAALHGLLRTLGDLGLPLVSLTHLEPHAPEPTTPPATNTDAR